MDICLPSAVWTNSVGESSQCRRMVLCLIAVLKLANELTIVTIVRHRCSRAQTPRERVASWVSKMFSSYAEIMC